MTDLFQAAGVIPPQRARGPRPLAMVLSVGLHLGLLAAIMVGGLARSTEDLPDYKVYRVDIYSPPPQALGEPEAAAKSKPAIVKPDQPKQVAIEKKPAPPKEAPRKNVTAGTGKSDVAKGRNPDPKQLVGGEGLDVHMEGAEFPYPEYLENIIIQLNRYFRWNGAPNLEVVVGFEIVRNGSVKSIRVLNKSGNINFDLEAISAIETAGKRGAFGPLPRGWVQATLPVSFKFEPTGR